MRMKMETRWLRSPKKRKMFIFARGEERDIGDAPGARIVRPENRVVFRSRLNTEALAVAGAMERVARIGG
jgi:hypothetical protein